MYCDGDKIDVGNSCECYDLRSDRHSAPYTNIEFLIVRIYLKGRLTRVCTEMLCGNPEAVSTTTRFFLMLSHKVTLKLLETR